MKSENFLNVLNETMKLTGASIGSAVATTATGKKARYTMNFNINHSLLLSRDAAFLEKNKGKVINHLIGKGFDLATAETAVNELHAAAIKSLSGENARSMAQLFAYRAVNGSVKTHVETGKAYLKGYLIQSLELEPGEPKKPVNSKPLTLAKNEARHEFMKSSKYIQLDAERIESFKMAGIVIK